MVQTLDYVPSFLEQIAPDVNKLAGGISAGIGQHYRNKADASILAQLQSGQISPANYPTLWAKLSPDARKTYEPFLQSAIRQQEAGNKEQLKRQTADIEKQEKLQSADTILDDLEKDKDYVGGWFGKKTFGGPLRRETVEKRKEINSEAIALEGYFRDLTTKGNLSKNVFNELLKRIPNSDMSEREYQGSINGIRKILKAHGLSLPSKSGNNEPQKKSSEYKELKVGQTFDKLPDPSEYPPNAILRNGDKRYRSDGKKWTEI